MVHGSAGGPFQGNGPYWPLGGRGGAGGGVASFAGSFFAAFLRALASRFSARRTSSAFLIELGMGILQVMLVAAAISRSPSDGWAAAARIRSI